MSDGTKRGGKVERDKEMFRGSEDKMWERTKDVRSEEEERLKMVLRVWRG